MEESFEPASFHPPAVDPAGANPSCYPSLVLLDTRAYIADRDNATTVKATTSTGHDVKVTFCLAEPPAFSYFCVHCPGISVRECCTTEPRVVSSDHDLALLCFALRIGSPCKAKDSQHIDYFVYKAASGGSPTITSVPCSPSYKYSCRAAVVPLEGNGFLVADLSPNGDIGHYNLHIFSSETNKSITRQVQLKEPPGALPWKTDKVISLGEGKVGWVNLWRGIVVCDVLQKDHVLCFLPLPKAGNYVHPESKARSLRDVTGFPNGFINFTEIEHCSKGTMCLYLRSFQTTTYLDFLETIRDTDILIRNESDIMEDEIKFLPDGWKIRTCFRSISWDHWKKGHNVHVDGLSAHQELSSLIGRLWDSTAQKCIVRNLKTAPSFPTFAFYGGDVVYLMSKIKVGVDEGTWILGVNLSNKSLEDLEPYCASRATCFDPTFISCAFSEYLNTTPIPRPCDEEVADEEVAAESDHLSSGDTVPNNLQQTKQNTSNGVAPIRFGMNMILASTTQDTTATISCHPVSHSSHPV